MRWCIVLVIVGCGSNPEHQVDAASIDGTPDSCTNDCAGVCGGQATIDRCGVCDENPTNDCVWSDSATAYCSTGTAAATCPSVPDGQDGDYQLRVPAYVITTDTVGDPITGLEWERNPPYTDIDQPGATTYCNNLVIGAASDWRLPTRLELVSLIDAGVVGPGFTHAAFTGVPMNTFFWTSTPVVGAVDSSWMIASNYPILSYFANSGPFTELVRCVRGAPFSGTSTTAAGFVFDSRTNLAWESDPTPTTMTWSNALAHCETLLLAGLDDWRLPSQKELASIVDDTQTHPAISALFAARPSATFWTSSPLPNFPTQAYSIDFTDGTNTNVSSPMTSLLNVRCVRSSQ